MKVGFVGLGGMGSTMACNLINAGHALTAYDKTRRRAEELQPLGAAIARTPAEAASGAEAFITMVVDDRALEDVIFGLGIVIGSLPAGSVHISISTMGVTLSHRLAAAHSEKNQHCIAAPVFGRPDAAAAARIFIVAAGPAGQIARCQTLFDAMGQKTFVVGAQAPAANLVKVAGNFLITMVIESLAKAFALIRKLGVDPNKILEVLTGSLFAAPIYRTYGAMVAADNFEPVGFRMPLGMKNNRLVLAAAEEASVPMPLARLIRDRILAATAQEMGGADWAAVACISFREAGL